MCDSCEDVLPITTAGYAQIQNRLAHLDDNASGIPGRELSKLLYGRDSVFARNPTPDQVRHLSPVLCAISRELVEHDCSRVKWATVTEPVALTSETKSEQTAQLGSS